MIRLALIGCVLVIAGCADVPALPHGTCGNFVLERGEDCDEPPGSPEAVTCLACSFACQLPGPDGCGEGAHLAGYDQCCPIGYACNGGGPAGATCAKPMGGLVLDSGEHFAASNVAIGDVTGDFIGDTIGLTEDRILVRSTGPDGPIDRETPFGALHSAFAVGPFDPGYTTDVVAGTLGGVAGFIGGADRLAAYPFASFGERSDGTASRIAILDSPVGLFVTPVVIDEVTDPVCPTGCAMISFGPGGGPQPEVPACGSTAHHVLDVVGNRIPTTRVGVAEQWLALGLHRDGVADALCRYRELDGTFAGPDPIALPAMAQLSHDGELVFADLDATGCPSLLVPLVIPVGVGTAPAIGLVRGGQTAGVCTLAATVVVVADSEDAVPLAAGDLYGNGIDEVITSEGIASLTLTPPTLETDTGVDSPRLWRGAAIVDFNADGRLDVVGHARDRDNIDLLRQVTPPPPPADPDPVFTTTLIDTLGVVRQLRPGDFDGDLFGDVMFVEISAPDERRLSVAFGQPAGGAPTIAPMARLGEVFDVDQRDFTGPTGFDSITDAIVVHTDGATLFYGRGTRQLIAPLVTQDTFGVPIEPIEVGIGDFDGDARIDLIALTREDSGLVNRYVASGDASGGFEFSGDAPSMFELLDEGGVLDEGLGVFTTARLGTSDRDVLVGFATTPEATVVATVIDGVAEVLITTTMVGTEIMAVIAADVDGLAGDELIVSVRSAGVPIAYLVEVTPQPIGPSVVDATSLSQLAMTAGYTCGVAVPIELDGDLGAEIIAACADGFRTELIALTSGGVATPLGDVPEPAVRLIAGDLTGDGVDDLLATTASGILYQFRQCSSRTVADCDPDQGTK